MVWVIIAILLILCILAYGTAYLFRYGILSKRITHKEVAAESNDWSEEHHNKAEAWLEKIGYETMHIVSHDGLKLVGYYVASSEQSDKLVVLVHGYGVDGKYMADFAQYYRAQGFHVFMADNRGHGQSEGRYIGMGWLDRLDQMLWLDVMIKKLGTDIRIVLHGVSMGAAAVMMMSGETLPENVRCIIEDCGYTSAYEEFKVQMKHMFRLPAFPILPLTSLVCRIVVGYSFKDASAINQLKKCSRPVLFIHGDADNFVPVAMVHPLYETARCGKELLIVPEAKHAQAYLLRPEEYQQKMEQFFAQYFV